MRHGKHDDGTGFAPASPGNETASHPDEEASALLAAGFPAALIAEMAARAARSGASIEDEILAAGMSEDAYFSRIATFLGVAFLARPMAGAVIDSTGLDTQLIDPEMLRLHPPGRAPVIASVPKARRLFEFRRLLGGLESSRAALVITSRRAVRRAVWEAGAQRRVKGAVCDLFDTAPQLSARITLSGRQGLMAGAALSAIAFALLIAPSLTGMWLHATVSLFYAASLTLRSAALAFHRKARAVAPPATEGPPPVYTVMVALYREQAVVPQLIAALGRLDWPVSRLDIKLVCEAGDSDTIAAIRQQTPGPQFEIVEVPAMLPVTKPKALSYALAGARGTFTVIYDAEDRPHPSQLKEAAARFASSPRRLACLQAPLVIANGRESLFSALFALEYAALFRSLLPALARLSLPLPLGGTSNHFRTDVLREVGGWDPFNVTEDADLGLRLHRLGYRSGVLTAPTLEDAPVNWPVWLNQRTRWYKGWMQTWLVTMRSPLVLRREIGTASWLVFHLLIGGMILSSLVHPLLVVTLGHALLALIEGSTDRIDAGRLALLLVDSFNIFGSYIVMRQMGVLSMTPAERRALGWRQLGLPVYWLALSFAAWRGLHELSSRPFFWRKTPHAPSDGPKGKENRDGSWSG